MFEWKSWLGLLIAVVIALVATGIIIVVTTWIAKLTSRRESWVHALILRARYPYRVLLAVIAVWIATFFSLPRGAPQAGIAHAFLIATIASGTWLVAALVSFALGLVTGRYRTDVADNRNARRAQTQIAIVRRLAAVVIFIVGIASILLTFPGVQSIGASVLASAGVVSIVAGLAAQSTLSNIFAGVQLAFSGAIRVDDVVIAQGEWGRIEEITLTYVVVHIWDDRRLVIPSTYFTSTPFENWTRHSSELLGSVEFDLDWRVSPAEMRAHLAEILKDTPLWDHRASVLQITAAVSGYVRVRILVSAVDAPNLFDLRCYVREAMVEWLHAKTPEAMPRTRIQVLEPNRADEPNKSEARKSQKVQNVPADQMGLFTGNAEAEQRASQFTGSISTVSTVDQDAT